MPDEQDGLGTITDDVALLEEGEEEVKPSGDEELEEDEESPDKTEEDDEEEEVKTEPKDEEVSYYDRPTIKQIKEKYPDFFKTFPQLRDMYFRESQFSKVFPTVEDAREAYENSDNYIALRDSALNGDARAILSAVDNSDSRALNKMAGNLLTTLYDISKDAHWAAVSPVLQNVVQSFYQEGIANQSDDLKNAALHLSKFLFNNFDVARGKSVVPQSSPQLEEERNKLQSEKNKFVAEKFNNFSSSVYAEGGNGLLRLIGGEKKLDPEGSLTKGMKDYIVNKIVDEVNLQMKSDPEHVRMMQSLWNKARRDGFGDQWKSRLTSAYLARAKSLIPSVRAKYVTEVLGTSAKTSDKTRQKVEGQNGRVEPGAQGRPSKDRPVRYSARDVDWGKTTDLDFLNDNVTLRKR